MRNGFVKANEPRGEVRLTPRPELMGVFAKAGAEDFFNAIMSAMGRAQIGDAVFKNLFQLKATRLSQFDQLFPGKIA